MSNEVCFYSRWTAISQRTQGLLNLTNPTAASTRSTSPPQSYRHFQKERSHLWFIGTTEASGILAHKLPSTLLYCAYKQFATLYMALQQ